MIKAHGFSLVTSPSHRIVAMTEFKGRLLVATEGGMYELIEGVLHSMVFAVPPMPVKRSKETRAEYMKRWRRGEAIKKRAAKETGNV